jgi:TetR/AcrR family transcriptional regulator, cholesterol catabolism regulator
MSDDVEPSRRERKKDKTRDCIFRAAIKLFRDKGFEETTVDDITEKADVAKGTFFNYFPRKEAVLGHLSEVWIEGAEEDAEAILAAKTPAREKLIQLLCGSAEEYEADRELSSYVIIQSLNRAFQASEEVHQRWYDLLAKVIARGQENREFRREVDPDRAAFVLHGVCMATVFMWLKRPEVAFKLQDELRARVALVVDGLAA